METREVAIDAETVQGIGTKIYLEIARSLSIVGCVFDPAHEKETPGTRELPRTVMLPRLAADPSDRGVSPHNRGRVNDLCQATRHEGCPRSLFLGGTNR
jgi:hypothetical protein